MIPVLVAWRSDSGHRQHLWDHLQQQHWATVHGRYRIFEGASPPGAFNRSAAINRAARLAGDWDIAVIADADAWVPISQLDEAVHVARDTGRLTAAFRQVIELTPACTASIVTNGSLDLSTFGVERVRTEQEPLNVQSLMVVIPRALWDNVGGMDEKFIGYGGEDNALYHSCRILAGEPHRVNGSVFHLWHTPAERSRTDPNYRNNQNRWRRYSRCRNERQLRAVQND